MKAPRWPFALVMSTLVAAAGLAALWPAEKAPLAAPVPPLAFPAMSAVVKHLHDPSSATRSPITSEAEVAGGMRAFRDPRTGALRQPEHEEIRALERKAARTRPDRRARALRAQANQPFEVPGGGVGIVLDESHMMSTVATIGPDGRVTISHQAPDTGGAPTKGRPVASPKEARDDR